MIEQRRMLEDLRRKRRKKVSILHTELSEFELIEHVKTIMLILRNLSFVRINEHQMMKCTKFIDIVVSLFIEYIDKELTFNCLDIITSLAKHIILKEISYGKELVETLYKFIKTSNSETILDQCMECLRRLCLSVGNDEYLEDLANTEIIA